MGIVGLGVAMWVIGLLAALALLVSPLSAAAALMVAGGGLIVVGSWGER